MIQEQQPFHLENIIRIYRGQPALVDGQQAQDLLEQDQYRAVNLIADGLTLAETAEEVSVETVEIRNIVEPAYKLLGVSSKDKLAGFLPFSPEHPSTEGKLLSELSSSQLKVLESLSVGYDRKHTSVELGISKNAVDRRVSKAKSKWPDCEASVSLIRTANAIRAGYVQKYEHTGRSIEDLSHIGELALNNLASNEPRLREVFGLED